MSGECGYAVLQENLRRIARAAGTELRMVGNLLVSESLPRFGHLDHIEAMGRFLQDEGIEVAIIDPAYLAFDAGEAAPNVFLMGALLRGMAEVFVAHNATMILLHHATKPAGRDGEPIDLADLSFSGFREFAAQWLLLSRRTRYIPGTGHHELWLSGGGRAGHSGLWAVDVEEGQYQAGAERTWQVGVRPATEARSETRDRRKTERDSKAAKELDNSRTAIVAAMATIGKPDSKTEIRRQVGGGHASFERAWESLVQDGNVKPAGSIRKGNRQEYPAFTLDNGGLDALLGET
jgi:hypothetical protein